MDDSVSWIVVREKKSASLTTHKHYIETWLMMLRNSMLAFVVIADDQNKSPEDEKDTVSVTTGYVRFLYLG